MKLEQRDTNQGGGVTHCMVYSQQALDVRLRDEIRADYQTSIQPQEQAATGTVGKVHQVDVVLRLGLSVSVEFGVSVRSSPLPTTDNASSFP